MFFEFWKTPKTARGVTPGALQDGVDVCVCVCVCSKKRAGTVKTGPSGPIYPVVPFHYLHAPHHSAQSVIASNEYILKLNFGKGFLSLVRRGGVVY